MKFSFSLALLAAFLLASCSEEPPPPTTHHGPVQPTGTPPAETAAAPSAPPTAAPTKKIAKGDYPYGIPVPGKPHLVESPYSPGKYIDVEGFPPGTEVKDP